MNRARGGGGGGGLTYIGTKTGSRHVLTLSMIIKNI